MVRSGTASEVAVQMKPSMRALRDSTNTNRLASISNKVDKNTKLSGPLQSRSGFQQDVENQYSVNNQNKNALNSINPVKPLQRQSSRSSLASQSTSKNSDTSEEVIIEEVRTSSSGNKTIHKYKRGRLLGKGGFAKVYLCKSLDTQKDYAVKIVPKANLVKSRARQKLQAEIKIHRTLKNQRICEFKHFFEDRKNCYILLELCPNQTLNELLKRRKRLTELEVMYFMHQIIEGVQYIHSCNVIHRDLKLGNLFLDRNMGVKIGDLGLAVKLGAASEKRTTICGTPNYIAPEVIDCLNGGQRGHSFEVDVWAMGVIMYATLVGKPPYESKDVKSTYKRILNNEYSFPSSVSISSHAKHLISGMLQSNPEHRPNVLQVVQHNFFVNRANRLPPSISSRCTRVAPIWRQDEHGQYIAEVPQIEDENLSSGKDLKKSQSMESRQPFTSLNPNGLQTRRDNQDGIEPDGKENRKPELGVKKGEKSAQPKFAIFSDTQQEDMRKGDKRSTLKQSLSSEEGEPIREIASEVANLKIGKQSNFDFPRQMQTEGFTRSTFGSHNVPALEKRPTLPQAAPERENMYAQSDANAIENMHSRLEKSFNAKSDGVDVEGPIVDPKMECSPVWVSRYVDYTSKYGLGFLLNDGSSGVYFNDSTKIVLAPDGDIFQYIERRKASSTQKQPDQEVEPTVHIYSLTSYPDHLQKKVTLLQHFRNYLKEQQQKEGGSENTLLKPARVVSKMEVENSTNSVSPYVYLKKWVRTRHAILFRLSNSTVQVVFYDHTEVLLSSEARLVTYVDKTGERTTYPIHEITKNPNGEVGKRLKYAKDILHQLISGGK